VRNNPLSNLDPTGNDCVTASGGGGESHHQDNNRGGQACAPASPQAPTNVVKDIPYLGPVLNWLVGGDDVAKASMDLRDAETGWGKAGEGLALALIVALNVATVEKAKL
jgi:hypothetical protein